MINCPITGTAIRLGPAAVLEGGFRPFFLMAGLYAALAILAWVPMAHGHIMFATALPLPYWHGHEMVFGFGSAALAGFLLTAVPNWIASGPVRGGRLALLAAIWLAGRVAAWTTGEAALLYAAIDLAFLPALAAMIAPGIIVRSGRRNGVFVLLLAILWSANLAVHLEALGAVAGARWGVTLGIAVLLTAISVIGGRIVPAFTIGGMRMAGRKLQIAPSPRLDLAAILGVAGTGVIEAAGGPPLLVAAAAGFAALANAARLARWQSWRTFGVPLVWVLHVGYAWLVAGFALKAIAALGLVSPSAALHALTAGAIGTMVLAVMTRASLGHTGHALEAGPGTVASYLLVTLGAALRVAGPLVGGELEQAIIGASGIAWAAGFLVFVLCYAPILLAPRTSGAAGC